MTGINVFSSPVDGRIDVARAVGSHATAMYIYELAPGRSSCPYHYEYEEEWLLVLDGTIVVRTPGGEEPFERGDIVCFPAGPGGAHKIMNRAESSAKIAVWPGNEADGLIFRRGTAVPYSDGEDGWEDAGG
jgi:uncharacterized cupin superfamily protein